MTRKGGKMVTIEIIDENGGVLWSFLRALGGKTIVDGIRVLRSDGWRIGIGVLLDGDWVHTDSIRQIQGGRVIQFLRAR